MQYYYLPYTGHHYSYQLCDRCAATHMQCFPWLGGDNRVANCHYDIDFSKPFANELQAVSELEPNLILTRMTGYEKMKGDTKNALKKFIETYYFKAKKKEIEKINDSTWNLVKIKIKRDKAKIWTKLQNKETLNQNESVLYDKFLSWHDFPIGFIV